VVVVAAEPMDDDAGPVASTSTHLPSHDHVTASSDQSAPLDDEIIRSVKAKFHYAIWFEAGSKLVADLSQTC